MTEEEMMRAASGYDEPLCGIWVAEAGFEAMEEGVITSFELMVLIAIERLRADPTRRHVLAKDIVEFLTVSRKRVDGAIRHMIKTQHVIEDDHDLYVQWRGEYEGQVGPPEGWDQ